MSLVPPSVVRSGTMVRTRGVVALLALALLAFVAWALVRPGERYSPLTQLALFDEDQRVANFRGMDRIFPYREVHAPKDAASVHHFASAPRALPETYSFGGKTLRISDFLERTTTTGLLVLHDDAIVSERYFLGTRADSKLTSWSMAKAVVSLLIGIARDEGRIGALTTPMGELAPLLSHSGYARATLRDVLQMSSGIAFDERYADKLADINTMFYRVFMLGESFEHYVAGRSSERAPGTAFHYISVDTQALGHALRTAVNMPLTTYLEQKLWRPLGMEHDALWSVEREGGMELAFCCLNVTLRDYAKIGRLVARGGDWDGKRIVSEAWIRASTHPQATRVEPGHIPGISLGYGYQWWIPPGTEDAAMALGVWGQYMYVNPTRKLVIVKTSVDPNFDGREDEHLAVFHAIEDAVGR